MHGVAPETRLPFPGWGSEVTSPMTHLVALNLSHSFCGQRDFSCWLLLLGNTGPWQQPLAPSGALCFPGEEAESKVMLAEHLASGMLVLTPGDSQPGCCISPGDAEARAAPRHWAGPSDS